MSKGAHLDIFRTGCERAATGEGRCCDAWNLWRQSHPIIDPDLSGEDFSCIMEIDDIYGFNFFRTDLSGCDIQGFNIRKSVLREANLSHAALLSSSLVSANLNGANLTYADLRGVDFRNADLTDAALNGAVIGLDVHGESDVDCDPDDLIVNLRNTDFSGASMIRANLRRVRIEKTQDAEEAISSTRHYYKEIVLADNGVADKIAVPQKLIYDFNDEAIFNGVSFASADMTEANLEDAVLSSVDMGVDFRCSTLIGAKLSRAEITNAKLWQAITEGWKIKGIKCSAAYWDRDALEATEYGEGEFERAFGEKPRIVLRYPGGMSAVDLAMLPLIVERLQAKHPSCALHIRSVEDAGSGAAVTITVDDLVGRDAETFMGEFETLRCSLMTFQQQLRHEERLRLQFEARYTALVTDIVPMLLDRIPLRQEINVGQLTGPIIEGTRMSRDTYNIQGQTGAVGPNAQAHDMTFQQVWSQSGLDLPRLAQELAQLRAAMKQEGEGKSEHMEDIDAVTAAEKAAKQDDKPAVLRYLKTTGRWTLMVAEKIGVPVAVEVLKGVLAQR